MAARNHNLYLSYKRDTNLLLYWIIRKSNDVIKLQSDDDKSKPKPNVNGQTTVAGVLSMSELIASHLNSTTVPAAVYRLFQSVIDKRTAVWEAFRSMTAARPDPDVEKSNLSHKVFIDALQNAFETLGGKQWTATQSASQATAGTNDEDEIKEALFTNTFSSLSIDEGSRDLDHSEDDVAPETPSGHTQRRRQARPGKGKKGKKKPGKKQPKTTHAKEEKLDDVPLESYRIIESEDGIMTEYLMAVYALASEWADLRNYLQDVWLDVAYNDLNSAVAGTLSNIAIAMFRRSELAIFLQFPGHDSYETVVQTITRGNPDKVKTNFQLQLLKIGPGGKSTKQETTYIDVKEIFLIHAYEDFTAFVDDFRHNRNGKPTKSMAAKISNWDPKFDLQHATAEERLQWRRAYTINWLYDLVNVYSAIVVQRNTLRGQNWDLSRVDWSRNGPWAKHIRLFGLNDFAGFVCSLAWQKQGVDIRKKILPHHMLQLQCIVDSMTVSRGWSISALKGHVLRSPAAGFRPRRDVDLFLDRECENFGSGFLQAAHVYAQYVEKSTDPMHANDTADVVRGMLDEFRDWLGESKYMYGLDTIPPSRFSSTNANGLWEYSPLLCGVGLVEGLDISYRLGMVVWDRLPEPILAVHLHNMLVQKGYIKQPVGLYDSLASIFSECFFTGGQKPTSDFGKALLARTDEAAGAIRRQRLRKVTYSDTSDLRQILSVDQNHSFRTPSNLGLYHEAEGNVEAIPDSDVTPFSMLAFIRLSQVRQHIDETGQKRLEETELVRRHLKSTRGDRRPTMADLVQTVDKMQQMITFLKPNEMKPQQMQSMLPGYMEQGYRTASRGAMQAGLDMPYHGRNAMDTYWRGSQLLEALKLDIYGDVCGTNPVSSLNYIWVAVRFFMLFDVMEKKLKEVKNKVYMRAFETDRAWERAKRSGLVFLAMETQDDECLRIMAHEFQNPRAGFMNHIFWKDLDPELNLPKSKVSRSDAESACVVM